MLAHAPRNCSVSEQRFDLDRGIAGQWALWVGRAVRFDFGESYLYNQPVRGLVARAALNTAILALSALVVATLCGIGLGVVTGWPGSGRWVEVLRVLSVLAVSVPPLVTSLLLVLRRGPNRLVSGGRHDVDLRRRRSPGGHGWPTWRGTSSCRRWPWRCRSRPPSSACRPRRSAKVAGEPFLVAASARGVSGR